RPTFIRTDQGPLLLSKRQKRREQPGHALLNGGSKRLATLRTHAPEFTSRISAQRPRSSGTVSSTTTSSARCHVESVRMRTHRGELWSDRALAHTIDWRVALSVTSVLF